MKMPNFISIQASEVASALAFSPSFYPHLLDQLFDGVYFVDRDRRICYWNHGAEALTGYAASEALGRHCADNFLVHINDEGCQLCENGCPLHKTLEDGHRHSAEVHLRHKGGHRVPVFVRVAPIRDATGEIVGAVEVFSDVTSKKGIERRVRELEKLVFLDALTGVPNRRYMELKVEQAVQEFCEFDRSIGLLMVDLDRFKQVNDDYGHEAGDEALRSLSRTLGAHLRTGDSFGRWGGEEFLVLVHDVGRNELAAFAERCRILIRETRILWKAGGFRIEASIGATLIRPGDNCQSVIARADELMYRSKAAGRNCMTSG